MISALLYKDLMAIKRYARTMLIIGVVCTLFFKEQGSSLIIIVYAASLLLTTLAIDEREHFFRRIISDKGRRNEIVGEKYILLILLILSSLVLSLAMETILSVIYKREMVMGDIVSVLAAGIALTSFSGGTTIPLTFKFGSEKARLMLLALYMVPAIAMIYLLPKVDPGVMGSLLFTPLLILFSLLYLALSYMVSLSVFKKKDF